MRRLGAIPALAVLSACVAGSPAQFKGDVDVFAEGVGNAKTAYEQQREDYVTYLESLEREVLLSTEPRPALLDGATLGACGDVRASSPSSCLGPHVRTGYACT